MGNRNSASLFGYAIRSVVPIGIAILVALWFGGSYVVQSSVEAKLRQHVRDMGTREVTRIQERLDGLRNFAKTLAGNDLLVNGLIDLEGRASYLPAFFRSLNLPASSEATVSLVDYKGRVVASNVADTDLPPETSTVVAEGAMGVDLRELVISEPVVYSGSPEGAIIVRYPASAFEKLFGATHFGSAFFLIDQSNIVIYSTDTALAAKGNPAPAEMVEGWLQVRNTLTKSGLSVVVASSLEVALKPLETLRFVQLFGLFLFLSVSIGLIVVSVFIVSRPLKKFAASISSIQDIGGLDRRLDTKGPREVAELAAAFNDMAAKLDGAARKERELQKELREAQKLEAVGQLAGGIAHEINTPAQYIGDNLKFLTDAHQDLFSLVEKSMALTEAARGHDGLSVMAEDVDAVRDEIDLEYLRQEIPSATEQSKAGIGQVSRIVLAMKEFSHPGTKEMSLADINRALENTLTISRNEWKHVAEVTTAFDEALPAVPCLAGEINQVFLNLIVNAAHAITEKQGRHGLGRIKVSTETDGENVIIRVEDDGTGIPEAFRDQVFNPFFTTKEVGQGTGQGLTIARDIVVKKHGGTIRFDTEAEKGTTFTVRLPIRVTQSARTSLPVSGDADGISGTEP